MRVRSVIWLLAAAALMLCGCRVSGEVENMAYVLILGVDRAPEGGLELTARVPRVGKAGQDDGSGGDYLLFSGVGTTWPQALDALEQATPRQMNLSHIGMIVVSEALAREADFGELASRIAETPHLYTTARFVVCEGRASDFVSAQQTVIGTRLSSDINAMLDHYARQGFIPQCCFADAWYLGDSIYGDGTAILAGLDAESGDAPAAALIDPGGMEGGSTQSPMRQRFSGAALFSRGRMVGTLDAGQTRLLNLIRGSAEAFPFECDGRACTLTPAGRTRLGVELREERSVLTLDLELSTLDDACARDAAGLESELASALTGVIAHCQSLGSEPFGFSEIAASRFATVQEWMNFGWRERYVRAEIVANVRIRCPNTR